MNNPIARGDAGGYVPMSWGGLEDCGERNDCNGGGQTNDAVAADKPRRPLKERRTDSRVFRIP
jgi:hypothetical protein